MLARRREEHLILQKNIATNKNFDYANKYKILKLAVEKIFELMDENRLKLEKEKQKPRTPDLKMLESIIIENTCLLSDLLLNFNGIIYEIFKKLSFDPLEKYKHGLEFTNQYSQYLDVITNKQIKFMIENFEKIRNYEAMENPFENSLKQFMTPEKPAPTETKKKTKKKLKKGPQLTSFGEL